MKGFQSGWYLIYTMPRHEKKVHAHLTSRKIDSFLPTQKKLRNWHDRKRIIDEPLFPSYVFIYLTDMQGYYAGLDAEGSLYYIKTGKEIARVSDTVIANLKLAAAQAQDIEVSDERFLPGRRLLIGQGSLTGLYCEVVQYHGKSKLLVRVDLLQRNLLLSLPQEYLVAM
ncbi:UpxY family transcription antiterminator [Paraflavitalea pollutisoli]|uniref:UpxY family transcription antiterminator n=1 Tax=Paraflavitalea pollutisoli TaxID=3034143 RepID=UPI0023EB658B|nr:UpxY family transcription antiterminator [Paraflavitalea sp. H1-2-19X]